MEDETPDILAVNLQRDTLWIGPEIKRLEERVATLAAENERLQAALVETQEEVLRLRDVEGLAWQTRVATLEAAIIGHRCMGSATWCGTHKQFHDSPYPAIPAICAALRPTAPRPGQGD